MMQRMQILIFHSTFEFTAARYFHLYKAHVLKIQLVGAGTPDKKIFKNELQRIGGNRILRGFDEQSILTSLYTIATFEYRYLLDKNSYAYAFYDAAYTEVKTVSLRQFDKPYGFGAGLAFETKAGIFQLSYALGSRLNNPIVIRNGKIHFGYLVSF
jgi:hemolysin activation/secretion protein